MLQRSYGPGFRRVKILALLGRPHARISALVPVAPILGEGLVARRLRIVDRDVVWLRGVLEGYDGIASLFGDGTGIVVLAAPETRARELDALLCDLTTEASIELLD